MAIKILPLDVRRKILLERKKKLLKSVKKLKSSIIQRKKIKQSNTNLQRENKLREISKKKIGITIKTYADETTTPLRLSIIKECLDSLKKYYENVLVCIVVDGQTTKEHNELIDKYNDVFTILKLPKNAGVSGATNYGIKYLIDNGVDVGFCGDDDILFKNHFISAYVNAIYLSGIDHFVQYNHNRYSKKKYSINVKVNDALIKGYETSNGTFYSFTRGLINKIGYLPILPYKFGSEHIIFTTRWKQLANLKKIMEKYDEQIKKRNEIKKVSYNRIKTVDIPNSHLLLDNNPKSIAIRSMNVDVKQMNINENFRRNGTYNINKIRKIPFSL